MIPIAKRKLLILNILFLLMILTNINPVAAQGGDCEQLAKEYQRVHGGDLIFIQPLQPNGAWELGAYAGHWINKAWNSWDGEYYYDPSDLSYFYHKDTINSYFKSIWNKDVVVLNYNKGEIPFAIYWHY